MKPKPGLLTPIRQPGRPNEAGIQPVDAHSPYRAGECRGGVGCGMKCGSWHARSRLHVLFRQHVPDPLLPDVGGSDRPLIENRNGKYSAYLVALLKRFHLRWTRRSATRRADPVSARLSS